MLQILIQLCLGIGALLLLFAIIIVWKLAALPYLRLNFYKKQGIQTFYYPFEGSLIHHTRNLKKTHDHYYFHKQLIKKNPQLRLFAANGGTVVLVSLVDPELIKDFYSKQDNYIKFPDFIIFMRILMGQGLLLSEGNTWKRHKKIISNIFHYEFLKSKIPEIQKIIKERLDSMEKTKMQNIDIMHEFEKITGEIVGQIFFGENLSNYTVLGKPLTIALADLLSQCIMVLRTLLRFVVGVKFLAKGWIPEYRKLIEDINKFKRVCIEMIEKRKQFRKSLPNKQAPVDMLDYLLDSHDRGDEDALSDIEIVDEFITFFAAGMDTTGHLATMIVYNLANHAECKELVTQEVDEIYSKAISITAENLNQMNYLAAVIKETLRFNTPVTTLIARVAKCDHYIGEFKIQAGTLVDSSLTMNNHNPLNHDAPEKFNPERWLDINNKSNKINSYSFIPFSSGQRNCIGQHLAQLETKLIVGEFLKRYEFKVNEGYVHIMAQRFLYEPFNPILLTLIKRLH